MATFKADGTGRVAMYSGADDLPFDSPRAYLSRLSYHSEFDYIAFASSSPTFDVTFSITTELEDRSRIITIGAHGKSGIPFVFGRVQMASGLWSPLNGSTRIFAGASQTLNTEINFHLAVSDTHVAILETRSYPNISTAARRVQIWVSENVVDGGPDPSTGDTLEWTPTRFKVPNFDSQLRYLRRKPGASLAISAGRTWTIDPGSTPANTSSPWQAWRYNNGVIPAMNFTTTNVSGTIRTDNSPPAVNPVMYSCMIGGDADPGGGSSSFEINPGNNYARVIDEDGTVVLDTREEIFHILSKVTGSVTRPILDWGSSAASDSRSADIDLGNVDPACTGVLGLARVTYSGTDYSDLPSGYWLVVGGTIVTVMKNFQSIDGNWGSFASSLALLSFTLTGGRARLLENIRLKDNFLAGPNRALAGFTLNYRLFCGTFT
jgi:hypothetical protein